MKITVDELNYDSQVYCPELATVPGELFLYQGEVPQWTDIQLEQLDKSLQHLLSLRVPLQQTLSTSFALFATLCKMK